MLNIFPIHFDAIIGQRPPSHLRSRSRLSSPFWPGTWEALFFCEGIHPSAVVLLILSAARV